MVADGVPMLTTDERWSQMGANGHDDIVARTVRQGLQRFAQSATMTEELSKAGTSREKLAEVLVTAYARGLAESYADYVAGYDVAFETVKYGDDGELLTPKPLADAAEKYRDKLIKIAMSDSVLGMIEPNKAAREEARSKGVAAAIAALAKGKPYPSADDLTMDFVSNETAAGGFVTYKSSKFFKEAAETALADAKFHPEWPSMKEDKAWRNSAPRSPARLQERQRAEIAKALLPANVALYDKAIKEFTSSHWSTCQAIRAADAGEKVDLDERMVQDWGYTEEKIEELTSALRLAAGAVSGDDLTVFRGLHNLPRDVFDGFATSDTIVFDRLSSTSIDPAVAESFALDEAEDPRVKANTDYRVIVRVDGVRGGLYASVGSDYAGEAEVIAPKMKIEVLGRYKEKIRGRRVLVVHGRVATDKVKLSDWNEDDHPREGDGKFAPKGGGGSGTSSEQKPKGKAGGVRRHERLRPADDKFRRIGEDKLTIVDGGNGVDVGISVGLEDKPKARAAIDRVLGNERVAKAVKTRAHGFTVSVVSPRDFAEFYPAMYVLGAAGIHAGGGDMMVVMRKPSDTEPTEPKPWGTQFLAHEVFGVPAIEGRITHEIGHALQPAFSKLEAAYAQRMGASGHVVSDYGRVSPAEYFAESFVAWAHDPEQLRARDSIGFAMVESAMAGAVDRTSGFGDVTVPDIEGETREARDARVQIAAGNRLSSVVTLREFYEKHGVGNVEAMDAANMSVEDRLVLHVLWGSEEQRTFGAPLLGLVEDDIPIAGGRPAAERATDRGAAPGTGVPETDEQYAPPSATERAEWDEREAKSDAVYEANARAGASERVDPVVVAERLVDMMTNPSTEEGFSWSPVGDQPEALGGIMVARSSKEGRSFKIKKGTPREELVAKAVDYIRTSLRYVAANPGRMAFGGWLSKDGNYYVDTSERFDADDGRRAVYAGRERNQQGVFRFSDFKTIDSGGTGM
jgi:hypothetical protein